jgi:CBS domain-containing protein
MSHRPRADDQQAGYDEPLVGDVMRTDVVTVGPDATVQELAKLFHEHDISGAPVVDGEGRLLGIVTEGDLIEQDADLHFPSNFAFFDGLLQLGEKRFEEELRRATGSTVKDLMSTDVITLNTEEPVRKAATIMADKHINRIPIVYEGKVVGIIGRNEVLKAMGL